MSKPTQRDRIEALVGKLDHEKTLDLSSGLKEVVSEAQNRPPQGAADGSLKVSTWEAARDVANALSDLAYKIDRLQKKLAHQIGEDIREGRR